jgi:hypothetical protein
MPSARRMTHHTIAVLIAVAACLAYMGGMAAALAYATDQQIKKEQNQ